MSLKYIELLEIVEEFEKWLLFSIENTLWML